MANDKVAKPSPKKPRKGATTPPPPSLSPAIWTILVYNIKAVDTNEVDPKAVDVPLFLTEFDVDVSVESQVQVVVVAAQPRPGG